MRHTPHTCTLAHPSTLSSKDWQEHTPTSLCTTTQFENTEGTVHRSYGYQVTPSALLVGIHLGFHEPCWDIYSTG